MKEFLERESVGKPRVDVQSTNVREYVREIERLKKTLAAQQTALESLFAMSSVVTSSLDLKALLTHMLELIMPVVNAKSAILWTVNPEKLYKCWEYLDCDRSGCPAHDNVDLRCWSIPSSYCSRVEMNKVMTFEEKLQVCLECQVFLNATLCTEACIRGDDDFKERELTVGDAVCKGLLLSKPYISVYHSFPKGDRVECYQQVSWLSHDAPSEPRLVEGTGCISEETAGIPRTKIGLGLMTKKQIIGIICLELDSLHYLSEQEVSLLTNIASIAAMTIENAQLYSLMDKKNQRMSTLCKEAHHRIKNNLQSLSGLSLLQLQYCDSPIARGILIDNLMRLRSISFVHQILSQEDNVSINLRTLAEQIMEMAVQLTNVERRLMTFTVSGDDIFVDSKRASDLAIILNELVTNSLKHGFSEKLLGRLRLKLMMTPDHSAVIEFSDNGKGFPEGFDIKANANLGLSIVSDIVTEDFSGSIEFFSDHGAHVRILFKL